MKFKLYLLFLGLASFNIGIFGKQSSHKFFNVNYFFDQFYPETEWYGLKMKFAINPSTGEIEQLLYNELIGDYQFSDGSFYSHNTLSNLVDSVLSGDQDKIDKPVEEKEPISILLNKCLEDIRNKIKTHKKKVIASTAFLACAIGLGIYKYKKSKTI